ncbi:MAG: ROK family protein [Lachnospiraceae bacterium]
MNKESKSLGALPSDLKIRNRMLVLNAMRDGQLYTTADIAEQTGISRPTVMKSIQYFLECGIMVSYGKGDSTESGGKKPELFSFVCKKLLLTITLWPDLLGITLCSMDLKKIAALRIEAPIRPTPKEAFDLIKEKSMGMLAEYGYDISDLYGVSLSTAGTIDYAGGLLKYSARSPGWGTNIPVRQYMQDIFGSEVELVIENAGKMAGRAELRNKELEDKRVLTLFSTWGLSACLIDKGHVLNGGNSLIGEVGHMVIDPNDTERCGCGSHGCAERMLSAAKIRSLIKQDELGYRQSTLGQIPIEQIEIRSVFEHSGAGDLFARGIASYLARIFAFLIRNISLVFDPEIVVFQGDFAHADQYFDEQLCEHLAQFKYYPDQGAFAIRYNRSPLEELDLAGAQTYLQHRFFQSETLYQE